MKITALFLLCVVILVINTVAAAGVSSNITQERKKRELQSVGTCPDGYSIIAGQCLSLIRYKPKLQKDAEIACNKRGGALAVPKDPQGLLHYYKQQNYKVGMWVGASDAKEEGVWRWSNGELLSADFPWAEGEPNNINDEEDFVILKNEGYYDYSGSCDAFYICEPLESGTASPEPNPIPRPAPSAQLDADGVICDGGVAIGGDCLSFSEEPLSWNDAVAACASRGGALASLTDPGAVLDYVTATYGYTYFWLGGSDAATEGTWVWLTNEPFGGQVLWGPGEPNDAGGNEDCLTMLGTYAYNDDVCEYEHRYICEAPSPAPTHAVTPAPTPVPTLVQKTGSPSVLGCPIFKISIRCDSNVQGDLKLIFPNTVSSWSLELTFSESLSEFQVYIMQTDTSSGSKFTLTPFNWNSKQEAGSSLTVFIWITYSGTQTPQLTSAKLDGQELCS